ncbi:hypothetical protein OHA88_05805 [Streptomyces sp. NBC_00353]|uniref:hypothetical protein n=1 Tax=Streptomyces sp. NBC_00353 TaxID=2975722 RepID=UPI002E262DE2
MCGEQLLDGEGCLVVAGRDLHHAQNRFRHGHYMVQRLYQAGQAWSAGESLPAKLAWGPHTPTDRAAVLPYVTKGYASGVFCLETAVRMLQEAGYPIEGSTEKIERIQKRAFEQATRLADATGDNDAVRHYLWLPQVELRFPPVPLLPPRNEEPLLNLIG